VFGSMGCGLQGEVETRVEQDGQSHASKVLRKRKGDAKGKGWGMGKGKWAESGRSALKKP